jgi:hypothetical protein
MTGKNDEIIKLVGGLVGLGLLLAVIQSCGTNQLVSAPFPTQPVAEEPNTTATTAVSESGVLSIRANGEDFVRTGFMSKDGWRIKFKHVYVTLSEVTAYQTDPAYDPEKSKELVANEKVNLPPTPTIDLALGDETAEPILVAETKAPAGQYNALSWKVVKPIDGPAQGYPLVLKGTATKDGQTIPFTLKFDQELAYVCGEFVGKERKGLLKAGDRADLEVTLHFDHLLGNAESPLTDDLNKGALGFAPLAALAKNGKLDVDQAALKQGLSAANYKQLIGLLPSLGHTGEGHCREILVKS